MSDEPGPGEAKEGEGAGVPPDAEAAARGPRPRRPQRPPAPMEPRAGYTAVGRVLRPHGIRGELRVQAFSPEALNIQPGRYVHIAGERRRVQRARPDRGHWILKVQGLHDRSAAEPLRGELIETPDREVVRESEESYFVHELIGLRVVTGEGRELGRLVEVLQPGANDVYVVRDEEGREALIPAIGEVIDRIDVSEGVMVITPLPGLVDESR